MADEADLPRENPLTSLLTAYDEQLATGAALPSLPESWHADVELLRLLDRLRPEKTLPHHPVARDLRRGGQGCY